MASAAIDQLLSELENRSAREVAAILAEARAEADRLRAAARAEVERRRAQAVAQCDRDANDELRQLLAAAARAGRAELLEAQHAFVDRVLARAKADAAARLLDPATLPRLATRVEELAAFIPDSVQIRCPTSLVAALEQRLRHQPRLRPIPTEGDEIGLVLVSDDGRLRIDDTVDGWLDATRAAHAIWLCHAVEVPNGAAP